MKMIFHISLLFLSLSHAANAQQDSTSKIHIGFVYPLSTNGQFAKNYSNDFSFHLLAGISANENTFCFSGLANFISNNARGLAFSGVLNYIGNDVKGLQFSGFTNIVGNNAKGLMLAGFNNFTKDSSMGLQLAGFSNIARTANSQIAGFSNISNGHNGTQISGFSNVSSKVKGLQLTGFANIAKNVEGVQIAGFINIAKKVKGAQVAGFINIADSCDYPIGLVNIIGNGEQYLGLTIDEMGSNFLTLRSGSKKLYGILGLGFNLPDDQIRYGLKCGIGMHLPINILFRLNTELSTISLSNFEDGVFMKSSLSFFPSMKFGRNFELFAGPSINFSNTPIGIGITNDKLNLWSRNSNGTHYGINIGGIAGLQIRL